MEINHLDVAYKIGKHHEVHINKCKRYRCKINAEYERFLKLMEINKYEEVEKQILYSVGNALDLAKTLLKLFKETWRLEINNLCLIEHLEHYKRYFKLSQNQEIQPCIDAKEYEEFKAWEKSKEQK